MSPAPYPALEATLVTLMGLMIGSFLNVCIYRLPRRMSPVRPRSSCTTCGHMITWYENIPIGSYLVLRGRCSGCGSPISMMYPLIEAITGAMFLGAYLLYGPSPLLVARLVFGCMLIALFVIDLQHKILPNVITLPGIVIGLLFSEIAGPGWKDALIGAVLGFGVLWIIGETYFRLRRIEGMGMGDLKMLGMIGAFLGWKLMIVVLAAASILGSLVGLGLIVFRRRSMSDQLPFGCFLAIGAIAAIFLGDPVLQWYAAFFQ